MREVEEVKVSVLMCAYNPVRDQLLDAVRSIADQTLSEWEMILVDDGSDISYRSVFKEAAAIDSRIRLFRRKKNGGLGAALNSAITKASGDYLARMDADDISEPDRLQRQYDFLEKHPAYMWVGSNAWLIDENGRWGRRVMPKQPEKEDFLRYSPYINPSVMFRAEVFDRCGGYQKLRRGEDYELFMRLHAMDMQGYNLQRALISYREDADSYRRRTAKSRREEVVIRKEGFRALEICSPLRPLYVIKPLFAAGVPRGMLARQKRRIGKETYAKRQHESKTSGI